jgi:sec-independent protein translocase protein TatB
MLDFGFEKLLVIGLVGVIVLGPERLPVAARMLGILWSKAQKATQKLRVELNELQKLAETPHQMLNQAEQKMQEFYQGFEKDAKDNLNWDSLQKDFNEDFDIFLQKQKQLDQSLSNSTTDAEKWQKIDIINQKSQFRQSNWRLKSMATPIWFQRKTQQKRRIEGAAARMQRYQRGTAKSLRSSIF